MRGIICSLDFFVVVGRDSGEWENSGIDVKPGTPGTAAPEAAADPAHTRHQPGTPGTAAWEAG
ncbi:MAG: hypothetical protein J2P36_09115 [Ktedonobacteraceae bacterium]|nr:hypothetical protein [Ktedonobacteraceae bacterium]